MRSGKACLPALVALIVAASAVIAGGCGKTKVDLSYKDSPMNEVVTYQSVKAVAPIYNPDVPVVTVYGDGTLIKKNDAYDYNAGMLEDGVAGLLETIQEKGFFDLKKEYRGTLQPGGSTETLTVRLSDKTYAVTVEVGSGPSNWDGIVGAVTGAPVTGSKGYIPPSIILYANPGTQGPIIGGEVKPWPGDGADLAQAASAGSTGVRLSGQKAQVAWEAIKGSFGGATDVNWQAGDMYYTYAHAAPILR